MLIAKGFGYATAVKNTYLGLTQLVRFCCWAEVAQLSQLVSGHLGTAF